MPEEPVSEAREVLPWDIPGGETPSLNRAGMVVDLRRCIGCHACSVACKTEHDVALGVFRTRVRYLEKPGRSQLSLLPLLCMHCQDAPCIPACPHDAITRGEDGRVDLGIGGGVARRTRGPGKSLLRVKLEPGTRSIRLTAKGYEPVTIGPVEIVEDRDTAVDVELTPEAE